ncbi:MAG TPA: hypothetical protein VK211_23960 [Kamptonema sp.]|nr:hypothetical protein [Kamptonema sp.]
MKLSFSRVHSLFLTGTAAVAIAIAHPLVAQASTVIEITPMMSAPNSILIERVQNVFAQKEDNPPKDESAGGSR